MKIRKVKPNIERSNSLLKTSEKTLNFIKGHRITTENAGIILGNYYESLIEMLHSYSFKKGFNIQDHLSFTEFISKEFNSKEYSKIFDKYRKLRNGLIYYGKEIPKEIVLKGIEEIKELIEFIKNKL